MRLFIFGASGSGTTTLGKMISNELMIPFFDNDDFFWEKTEPPFTLIRQKEKRIQLLNSTVSPHESWVLSGSMIGWGDFLIPMIDLSVYLYLQNDIRMERLINREKIRYGNRIEIGNDMYKQHKEFIEWASKYDTANLEMRSKKSHEEWMKQFKCKIIKIEGAVELQEKLQIVLKET